ncbi:hypothetical protein Gohar_008665 [Gossypium harknessii]|uniref:Uncharacterized protein n=1 Tax=Gossypium harknessii TaxID=34285 RepID=A0A7J9GKY9_9ROSI|nr:hypothetical protein [Gossypium harknessii]
MLARGATDSSASTLLHRYRSPTPMDQQLRFKCKVCNKPSTLTRLWVATKPATALRGHKHLYYEGGAGTAKGITTSERSASTNTTNQWGFDLNLLALPEFSPSNLFVFGDDDEVESPHPSKKPRLVKRMPPKVEVN